MQLSHILKKVTCVLLALLMLFLTAGCGKDSDESKSKKKVIIKKKIITVDPDQPDEGNDDFYVDSETTEQNISKATSRTRRELSAGKENFVESYDKEFDTKTVAFDLTADYVIVYSSSVLYAHQNAVNLQQYFKTCCGLNLTVCTDDSLSNSPNQILVGNTTFYKSPLEENQYSVSVSGSKLIFEAGHFMVLESAVDWFTSLSYEQGYINTLKGTCQNFASTKETQNGIYNYVWGDEFSGNTIDDNKWYLGHMTDPESTRTATQENCPEAFNVSDGRLKLSQIRYYDDEYPQYEYANGSSICNKDRMGYVFGYAEMRARVPFVRGSWPSWWLNGIHPLGAVSNNQYFVEVDIFEIFSSKNTVTPNLHKWFYKPVLGTAHTQYNDGIHAANEYVYDNFGNLRNEYHTYGFEWSADSMTMSVDGQNYQTFDLNSNYDGLDDMQEFKTNPLEFVISNMLCTADNQNAKEIWRLNNIDLPFCYYIDYIRLYQNKNQNGNKLYVRDTDGSTYSVWN